MFANRFGGTCKVHRVQCTNMNPLSLVFCMYGTLNMNTSIMVEGEGSTGHDKIKENTLPNMKMVY